MLSAPALEPGTPIPRIKLIAGRLAGKLCPRLTIDNGLDLGNISRIEAEVQRFMDDPLCHEKISLQTGCSPLAALIRLTLMLCSWLHLGYGRVN